MTSWLSLLNILVSNSTIHQKCHFWIDSVKYSTFLEPAGSFKDLDKMYKAITYCKKKFIANIDNYIDI